MIVRLTVFKKIVKTCMYFAQTVIEREQAKCFTLYRNGCLRNFIIELFTMGRRKLSVIFPRYVLLH